MIEFDMCESANQALCHGFFVRNESRALPRGKRLPGLRPCGEINLFCARTTHGSFVPAKQQRLFECERAAIPDALASEQRYVTTEHAALHAIQRHRLSELQLDPHPG
jgi:hypothetical protein